MDIARKVQVLITIIMNYFWYTARPKSINPLHHLRMRRERYSVQRIKKNYPHLYSEISEILTKSSSTGGEWSDYLTLYEVVRRLQPNNILELGSGISSLVICHALNQNNDETEKMGMLFSMEENDFYHENIKSIFPKKYSKYVNFLHSPRKEKEFEKLLGSYYENIPNIKYDFIFIDGPTDRKPGDTRKSFNADLVNLINDNLLDDFYAVLDQRITTYLSYKKLLPKYKVKYDVVKKITCISPKD
jgi:hypothetical protein